MKEMTIEQKAKAYDKAIEHARSLLKTIGNTTLGNLVLKNEFKNMFPVLEESEDEMVRKALITYHSSTGSIHALDNFTSKQICAWLEKQGEKDLVTCPICGWEIKKQGEQKPSEWHREDEHNLNACLGYIPDEFLRRWLTDIIHVKYDKPADKVEPKFKKGDWLIFNGLTLYVKEVVKGFYRTITIDSIPYSYNWDIDKVARLWTIKDAKDGDVLCTYECDEPKIVFILKGTPKKHYALSYHCYYNIMYPHFGSDSEKGCLAPNDEDVKPATKEQRDTLEKAIADAGYTFDFEKKELKKIVAPIFHIGDRVRYKEHACNGVITEITDTDYICGDAKLPISTQDKLELVEQNSAWSEEDEKNYDISLKIMCASNKSEELINKLYDWFKSLKDRVQPKQKWSEEDENIILRLIDYLYGKSRLTKDREDGISWLKCLKDRVQPQNAWKPSKEQMNTLGQWLKDNQYKGDARYCYPIINSLYKDLLKLMEK